MEEGSKNTVTDKGTNISDEGPWEELYREMRERLPQNDLEKETLIRLSKGEGIGDCFNLWKEKGLSYDEFFAFLERANEWETSHLCGTNGRKE